MYSNLRSGAVSSQSWCGVPLRPYSVILRSHGHMGGKLLPLGPQLPHHIGQGKWSHFQGCEPLGVSIPQQSTHHMLLLLMGLNGWRDGTSPVLKCADHCHLVSVTVVGSEVKVFIRVGRLFKSLRCSRCTSRNGSFPSDSFSSVNWFLWRSDVYATPGNSLLVMLYRYHPHIFTRTWRGHQW